MGRCSTSSVYTLYNALNLRLRQPTYINWYISQPSAVKGSVPMGQKTFQPIFSGSNAYATKIFIIVLQVYIILCKYYGADIMVQ